MKQLIFNNLFACVAFLFCLTFGLNLNAKKECIECGGGTETNKKMIDSNDLSDQISQIIKAAFEEKKVKFEIPQKMEAEFNAKKQALLNNLNQTIKRIKTNKVYLPEVTKIVNEAFDFFIERVKYVQYSEEIHSVLSNIKKNPKATNSSCMFRDRSFRTKSGNQK